MSNEAVSLYDRLGGAAAVEFVTEDREPQLCRMDPNLVGASCDGRGPHHSKSPVFLHHLELRCCLRTPSFGRTTHVLVPGANENRLDFVLPPGHRAVGQEQIGFLHRVVEELVAK